MNPDVAFERCLELLYEAALDDARCPAASAPIDEVYGVGGNALTVGNGTGGGDRQSAEGQPVAQAPAWRRV